ncbi:MAG: hypothetical protein ACLGHT_01655 [Acidimicrobiia bacterium]
MTEEKTPVEQALDLFLYAPLGLALSFRDELPKLIERGRTQVNGQVQMAKMMGQFATQAGQKEAEKFVRQASERAAEMLGEVVGDRRTQPAPGTATASRASTTTTAEAPQARTKAASDAEHIASGNGKADMLPARPVPAADTLSIPGYDTLSASQVVQRLAALGPDELEAIEVYERANRSRRTILNRVDQLRG